MLCDKVKGGDKIRGQSSMRCAALRASRAAHGGELTPGKSSRVAAQGWIGHGQEDLGTGGWVMGLSGHRPTVREPAGTSIRRAARPDTENYGFAWPPLVYIT